MKKPISFLHYLIFLFFPFGIWLHFAIDPQKLPWTSIQLPLFIRFSIGLPLSFFALFLIVRSRMLLKGAAGRLVSGGVYAISRNPLILGLLIMLWGLAFFFQLFWWFVLSLPGFILTYYFIILPEESDLHQRFGIVYENYCLKVRRWI